MSGTDSEDDAQFKQAIDLTLFTNSMFEHQLFVNKSVIQAQEIGKPLVQCEELNLQRYSLDKELCANIKFQANIQNHIFKKLSEVIEQRVDFCEVSEVKVTTNKAVKSKLKLLRGANCYVKPYAELQSYTQFPMKRLNLKRVKGNELPQSNMNARIQSAVIEAVDIFAGNEIKHWAIKPFRTDKLFLYKLDDTGVLRGKSNDRVRKTI